MRKYLCGFFGCVLLFMGCSKDRLTTQSEDKTDIVGTWSFNGLVGYETANVVAGFKIYEDSIAFAADGKYFFINNGDTTDWGKFTLGHSQQINGLGRMQQYDSIVYHSENRSGIITLDAMKPTLFYFKVKGNDLSMSVYYFKDYSKAKLYHNYRRVKSQ